MKRKMFSILTSSTLLLQGINSSIVLANDKSKFEPMEEVETLTEEVAVQETTITSHSGTLGPVDWTIDGDGTLTIGAGEFKNEDPEYNWPWKEFSNEIIKIDGTAEFSPVGNYCNALSGLENLKEVKLSGWDTSQLTNTSFMFSGDTSLNSLNLSSWKTTNITDMRWMFAHCSALTYLNISNWKTSNVTDMSFMFSDCSSLNTLDVSDWDTTNVTDMSGMFSVCHNLESLDLSDWITSNVTDMSGMFSNCYALTSLKIATWETTNVIDMSELFLDCIELISLDISNWETLNLAKMDSIFSNSNNLEEIKYNSKCENLVFELLSYLPEDLLWDQNNKGPYLSTEIPFLNEEKGTLVRSDKIAYGLLGTSIWTIDKNGVMTFGSGEYVNDEPDMRAFGREWYKYASQVKKIDGRAKFKISGSISNFFYYDFPNLEAVDLSGWDVSEVTSLERMFESCTLLKDVNLSGWDTSNVTNLQAMFLCCENLEKLDLNHFNVASVTDLSGMFEHCHSLKELDLSKWDISKVEDMTYLFDRCYALKSLNLNGWKTSSLAKMGWMFRECNSLKSLDLSSWDISKVVNIDGVFYLNTGLEKLDLSGWDTSSVVESDEERFQGKLFEGCENLYQIKYTGSCEDLLVQLSGNWYQDDNGSYATNAIPSLDSTQSAVLTREDKYIPKPTLEEPKKEENDDSKPAEDVKDPVSPGEDEGNDANSSEDENPSNDPIDSSGEDQNPNAPSEDESPSSPSEEDPEPIEEPTPPVDEPTDPSEDLNQGDSDDKEPNASNDEDQNPDDSDLDDDIPFIPTPTTGEALSITLNLSVRDIEGVTTENGKLPEDELVALEAHINKTPDANPYGYAISITEASVTKNNGKYDFKLTVTVKLKNESKINLIFNNLKKKLSGREAALITFEDEEKSYEVIEKDDLVIIKGITVEEAFNGNEINSTLIKSILSEKDYETDELDFSSTPTKDSSFALEDLTSPIAIQITTKAEEPAQSVTPPSSDSSSSKPYRYPIDTNTSSTAKKALYRLYNTLTGEHFYTASEEERNQLLLDERWKDEGQGWISPESSDTPIYRLVNPNNGDHHYTIDKNELETLQTVGWLYEGIGLYSAAPEDNDIVQLHRLYNPNANNTGSHHYTVSEEERDKLVQQGWNYEGIAWYGLKSK